MKTIFDHIEYAKSRPHHVRKRIAFTAAAIGTGLVALVWFFGSLSSGIFAIQGSTFAQSTGAESAAATDTGASDSQGVAGAAAAISDAQTPAHIEIIDAATSSSAASTTDQTVIPF